jgi:hypothetical protein
MAALVQGVYTGIIVDTTDPLGRGRVRLQVPQLTGLAVTTWATPAAHGVTQVGDQVTVAHDGSDRNYPVFWPIRPVPVYVPPTYVPPAASWSAINNWGPNAGALGGGWQVPGYWRDPYGMVHLTGLIGPQGSNLVAGQVLFTLSSPYAPLVNNVWTHLSWDGGDCAIYGYTNGQFKMERLSGTVNWISISTISYLGG